MTRPPGHAVLFTDGSGSAEQPTKIYLLFYSRDMRDGWRQQNTERLTHRAEQANLTISIHTAAFLSLPTFTYDKFQ